MPPPLIYSLTYFSCTVSSQKLWMCINLVSFWTYQLQPRSLPHAFQPCQVYPFLFSETFPRAYCCWVFIFNHHPHFCVTLQELRLYWITFHCLTASIFQHVNYLALKDHLCFLCPLQVSLPPLLASYPHVPPSTSVHALHVHCPLNHLISSTLLSFCL